MRLDCFGSVVVSGRVSTEHPFMALRRVLIEERRRRAALGLEQPWPPEHVRRDVYYEPFGLGHEQREVKLAVMDRLIGMLNAAGPIAVEAAVLALDDRLQRALADEAAARGKLEELELQRSTPQADPGGAPVVRFAKVHPDAHIPKRMTIGAAGFDLFAFVEQPPGFFPSPINPKGMGMGITVEPRSVTVVRTGVRVAIPPGYEGQVRPRSGLARAHRVTVLNSPGTIDADFRGELKVLLINHGIEPVLFFTGERIAQLVIAPVARLEAMEVAVLEATERGTSGFGSTGR